MSFAAPFVSRVMEIEKDWIDYNGHLNMAFYNVLFDRCSDDAFETMGMGPDYAKQRKLTIYTAEVHVCYVQELHLGHHVTVSFQLIDHDDEAAAGLSGDPPCRRLARGNLRIAVAACRYERPEGGAISRPGSWREGRSDARRPWRAAPARTGRPLDRDQAQARLSRIVRLSRRRRPRPSVRRRARTG